VRGLLGFEDVERASLWRRLSAMERAGIPVQTSIGRLIEQGGAGARALGPVAECLKDGVGIGEAFKGAPAISQLEQRLIDAGSRGGRLVEVMDELGAHFEDRAAVKRALVAGLAYPVFLVHAAIVLPSIPLLVSDGVGAFFMAVLTPLAIAYAVIAMLVLGWRALRSANPRAADGLVLSIPLVGAVAGKRALSSSLDVLRLLYASGVPILEAVEAAASACPNAAVGERFVRIRARMGSGESLAQAFSGERDMPTQVLDLVTTGETSGRLDDLLGRAARALDDEAKLARRALIAGLGVMAFLVGAGIVAYKVISFWAGYFGKINDLTGH
jgi:general secretion pathway protein F